MGRSKKVKERGIPVTVQADGEGSGGGLSQEGKQNDVMETELVIKLVDLDSATHASATAGDPVSLNPTVVNLNVLVASGARLGDVAASDINRVRASGFSGGRILRLEENPIGARISLS